MDRSFHYRITEENRNQKISTFLKIQGYSEQNLVDLKKDEQSIWLNGECVHLNHMVTVEDEVRVELRERAWSEQIEPVELPLDIVYEDEDLLVINKPAGMPIHPSRRNPDNTLGNALMYYFRQKDCPFVYRCTNRLDRDTSGLTIVAKHSVSAAILNQMIAAKVSDIDGEFRNHSIQREYLALVEGHLQQKKGIVNAPIARKESLHLERMVDFKRGERAVTHYEVVEEYEDYSLVSCVLETGRTHQIRVHMSYLGHPLLGDFLYNPQNHVIGRQALHAHRLELVHPMTGEHMEFAVQLPEDMRMLLIRKPYH